MKKMISIIAVLFSVSFLFSSTALAHITNEKNIYDDIQFSKVQEQIVILRTIGALAAPEGVNLFKPQEKLTRAELAYYIATFDHLADDTAKEEVFEKAALQKKRIISLDGNATYQDVDQAFFGGKAPDSHKSSELTHEDYVRYLSRFLTEKVDGKTLYDLAGAANGPTGTISDVKIIKEGTEDQYVITIEGMNYKINPHGKVLYGPVDLQSWGGKKVDHSILVTHDGEKVIGLIVSAKGQFADDQLVNDHSSMGTHSITSKGEEKPFPFVPMAGGGIVVILFAWIFVVNRSNKKKRKEFLQ
ncbi:hypothetical protein E2K98_28045 [Bacillus salipaludis]|uniref:S-layer homology domain-containing protein n=1 Tax=Bacillus salipaludis TaxID=2547811 RepID=A0A4R5VIV9_9BACI|nr:hypothetical protein [Bacillus salipaludis]MDQ6600598.1 hypothetical protein [Bacillus salipaludis]TDK55947.1 hypothetical protein E2K98_28045 [Bacillus salipaludis]